MVEKGESEANEPRPECLAARPVESAEQSRTHQSSADGPDPAAQPLEKQPAKNQFLGKRGRSRRDDRKNQQSDWRQVVDADQFLIDVMVAALRVPRTDTRFIELALIQ